VLCPARAVPVRSSKRRPKECIGSAAGAARYRRSHGAQPWRCRRSGSGPRLASDAVGPTRSTLRRRSGRRMTKDVAVMDTIEHPGKAPSTDGTGQLPHTTRNPTRAPANSVSRLGQPMMVVGTASKQTWVWHQRT
jgi:hypothetical protein